MSQTRVWVWHKQFLQGLETFKDMPHTGRPCSVRIAANLDKVRAILDVDKRVTIRKIAEEMSVPKSSVHTMIQKDLKFKKLAPKMVPMVLTDEQKRFRVHLCESSLESLRTNPNLMETVVTGDKSGVSILEVDTKQSSCQWLPKGTVNHPTKARRQRVTRKSMLTMFFDVKDVVHSEFIAPGETVDSECYIEALKRLREAIRCKHPHLWSKHGGSGQEGCHVPVVIPP